jgi:hypothetical protein
MKKIYTEKQGQYLAFIHYYQNCAGIDLLHRQRPQPQGEFRCKLPIRSDALRYTGSGWATHPTSVARTLWTD